MKNAKAKTGNRKAGIIRFGKARSVPPMVEVDVSYDEKTEKYLYKAGMIALKHDKEAVIAYVIRKALEEVVKCKK
jgi:phosphopantetheinyl transferase (holo-ACP synthase)